ncbi:hypothetical protein CEP10_07910 [Cylindrospermopsis raciborskii S07]|nr:hypothetical protein CEP12_11370 [Cylindrospermopsis raciborskii S14]PNK07354.1 hypothetical protein CEP11_04610 [Cylindrospermopsis raciborskii S10]PNK08279.1 hypothetical protein CEP10_07910 [Cylindrospermopsis raciborskii S07]PNK15788.1 hypothetical protein CEP09_09080 [Cylindrospermopsis raciborskii S06]
MVESKKNRIIQGGGGRKPKLSPSEQIILTLTYNQGGASAIYETPCHSVENFYTSVQCLTG